MITIKSFDGAEFDGYLALPDGGYGPGIVLLQEIFGVNESMRTVADWYAARGFVVVCPDLFWRQEPGVQLTDHTEADLQKAFALYAGLDEAKAVDDSAAALELLRRHPACNGKVGALGFCLGGNLAYLLAVRYQPDCAVGYYGVSIEKSLAEAPNLSSPLMLHIAGKDKYCPPAAQAQIHQALGADALVTIHDYPEQDHAFGRRGGEHYDAAAAELAHLRTLEFFVRHLVGSGRADAQTRLSDIWDEHVKYEFATRDTEDTLRTMVPDAYVNHVPVMTGGVGHEQLREFYSRRFIPQMPPDTSMTPVSRTIGVDQVVDEMVFEFTHTVKMDWMLPGVEPTGKHVKVPLVVIVHFRDGKLAHEHIYWDQASVLVQLGLIDQARLPVAGVASAEKVLDPSLPANEGVYVKLMYKCQNKEIDISDLTNKLVEEEFVRLNRAYEFHLDFGLKAVAFFYAAVGGVLSIYFGKSEKSWAVTWILLGIPTIMSAILCYYFFHGVCLWRVHTAYMKKLADRLKITQLPNFDLLSRLLRAFGFVFLITCLAFTMFLLIPGITWLYRVIWQ